MQIEFNNVKEILDKVVCIKNKNGDTIPYNMITFKHVLLIDGQKISKRCTNRIVYVCIRCEKMCILRLATFANKIRRGYKGCKYCYTEHINICIPNLSEIVSSEYFKKELTESEFNRISSSIHSIQNKFTNLNTFNYIPIVQYGSIFKPMLYDKERNVYEDLVDIVLTCDKCQGIFSCKFLNQIKNNLTILCNECKRIKSLKFGVLHNIIYKTTLEMKFIDYAIKNGIELENKNGQLYITKLDKCVNISHKKFKKKQVPNTIYSDEFKQQIDIIKKQIIKLLIK
jgi:hypothetical protein